MEKTTIKIKTMTKLYEWNGVTNLNWILEHHAKFWMWNDEGLANDSIQSQMGLLSYTELENYYFLSIKVLFKSFVLLIRLH